MDVAFYYGRALGSPIITVVGGGHSTVAILFLSNPACLALAARIDETTYPDKKRPAEQVLGADDIWRAYIVMEMRLFVTGVAFELPFEADVLHVAAIESKRTHVFKVSHAPAAFF